MDKLGQIQVQDLPKDLVEFLKEADGNTPEEQLEVVEERLFNNHTYDSCVYNYLSNHIYHHTSPYIIKFLNIPEMANYVRENNITIIDNLLS